MYEQFATVYDEMMEEIPYDEWFIKFQEILKEHGITSGHVCELGCGTGEMVSRFAICLPKRVKRRKEWKKFHILKKI